MKNMLQSLMAEEQTWERIKFIPRAQRIRNFSIKIHGSE